MRTQKEIDEQIKWLRDNQSKIPAQNLFGDDNHAAIKAQIDVLEDALDEDDADQKLEDEDWSEHEYQNARDVINWRDDGDDEAKPSTAWATLVKA